MKVTIASGGSPDYLIDIVADGVIRAVGRENVHLDYNQWTSYYGCWSQLMVGFAPDTLPMDECGILIASRRVPIDTVKRFREKVNGKIGIIDGEDWTVVHPELLELCDAYFLREFIRGASYPAKVRPLNFAAIPESLDRTVERDIPVMFSAGDSADDRPIIRRLVEAAGWDISQGYTHDEYMKRLCRARIGINVRGHGWDTYRYWETPWAGTLLLSQKLSIVIEKNFVDGVEAVFFDSPEDCIIKARELLADPARLANIAAGGLQAVRERHSSIHRAQYVFDVLGA